MSDVTGDLNAFARRLREERDRKGLSQKEFAELAELKKNSQIQYEGAKTAPSVEYLYRLAGHGVDIGYVLTGKRTEPQESEDIRRFVEGFQRLSERERVAVMGLVKALGSTSFGEELAKRIAGDQFVVIPRLIMGAGTEPDE